MTQLRLKERDIRTTTVVLLICALSGHARVLAHTDGDAYLFLPGVKVLHTGDLGWNAYTVL